MFFHNDLDLYKNEKFRSFNYLESIWSIINFDIIFIIGMLNNGNITLSIESDYMQITATSNFKTIFNKTYSLNISHSLSLCYDFVIDITINIICTIKEFYFQVLNCKYYYDKKSDSDEGFIECILSTNLQIENIEKFKIDLFCLLSKEIQFVINKNVFFLDIEKEDLILCDIDAIFESIRCKSKLSNINILEAVKSTDISQEDKKLIKQLIKQLSFS